MTKRIGMSPRANGVAPSRRRAAASGLLGTPSAKAGDLRSPRNQGGRKSENRAPSNLTVGCGNGKIISKWRDVPGLDGIDRGLSNA